jgi:GTP-binding protein
VLTKADKLGRKQATDILRKTQEDLGELTSENSDVGVVLFSALSRQGVDDLAMCLREWCPPLPEGAPVPLLPVAGGTHERLALDDDGQDGTAGNTPHDGDE